MARVSLLKFLVSFILLATVGLVLLVWSTGLSVGIIGLIKDDYSSLKAREPTGSDFRVFYFGAQTMLTGDRAQLYDGETIRDIQLNAMSIDPGEFSEEFPEENSQWMLYYNPPVLALLMAPLTFLDVQEAYLVSIGANLLAVAGLILLSGIALQWRQPSTILIAAAVVGFFPVYFAVFHSQPSIFVALLLIGAFLVLERGRDLPASLLLAFTIVKPQWAILAGISALRSRSRLLVPLFVAGSILGLLPFVFLGLETVTDYVNLVAGRGSTDLDDPTFSVQLLSWSGFLRGLTGAPQSGATVFLAVLTLAVFLVVLRRGDQHLAWAAAVLTTLIVVPHSHVQDWIMVVPAAVLLMRRPMAGFERAVTVGLLLTTYIGVNSWMFAVTTVEDGGRALFLATPAAFLLVVWCAVLPWMEEHVTIRTRYASAAA